MGLEPVVELLGYRSLVTGHALPAEPSAPEQA